MTPEHQLRARPRLEQAVADYRAMLTKMRAALDGVARLTWDTSAPLRAGEAPCRPPFSDVPDAGRTGYRWTAEGRIGDDAWPQVVHVLTGIAARHGFTTATPVVDSPGHHVVSFHHPWDGDVEITTQTGTVLYVATPCLLLDSSPADPD